MESQLSKKQHEAKRRVKRIVTKFVSLVDKPATEIEFAVFKRLQGGEQNTTVGEQPQASGEEQTGHTIGKEADMTTAKKTKKGLPDGTWNASYAIKSALSWIGTIAGIGGDPWDTTGLGADTINKLKGVVTVLSEIVGFPEAVERTAKNAKAVDKAAAEMLDKVKKELEELGASPEPLAPLSSAALKALNTVLKDVDGSTMDADIRKQLSARGITVSETAKDEDPPAADVAPAAEPAAAEGDTPPAETTPDPAPDADTTAADDVPAADSTDDVGTDTDDTNAGGEEPPAEASDVNKSVLEKLDAIADTQKAQGDRLSQLEELGGVPQADDDGATAPEAVTANTVAKAHGLSSFAQAVGLK